MKHILIFLAFFYGELCFAYNSKVDSLADSTVQHEYVDLGLASGTLWATCNVGATQPWEYGDHFAWGEVISRDNDYVWETYKWCEVIPVEAPEWFCGEDYGDSIHFTKYVYSYDDKSWDVNHGELLPEDDAATVLWGEEWCTPSKEQIKELTNNRLLVVDKIMINGVAGLEITSKSNGNSIFLPAAGSCAYSPPVTGINKDGSYWSKSAQGTFGAYYLRFGPLDSAEYLVYSIFGRFFGMSIRPVRAPSSCNKQEKVGSTKQ